MKIINSNFKAAIDESLDKLNLLPGLQAIIEGKSKITAQDTRNVLGSVNLDADLCLKYPQDNRVDYAVGYNSDGNIEKVYFVEVHSATASQVSVLMNKARALRDWALEKSPSLWNINKKEKKLYWVASGRVAIPRQTPQYKKIATSGLIHFPTKLLVLK